MEVMQCNRPHPRECPKVAKTWGELRPSPRLGSDNDDAGFPPKSRSPQGHSPVFTPPRGTKEAPFGQVSFGLPQILRFTERPLFWIPNGKSGFAVDRKSLILRGMDDPTQVLEEARRAGIDLDLLDTNLALSVKERWNQHDAALELALKLEEAGTNRDAKLQPTPATTG